MNIDVWRLAPEGERFCGEEPPAILELPVLGATAAESGIRYDLTAQLLGQELMVRGVVAARIRFVCSRCAEEFVLAVRESGFERSWEVPDKHVSVDLTADIREAMILAFPTCPVCAPACRGLCAHCGANLNRGACGCASPPADGRWHALSGLKLK